MDFVCFVFRNDEDESEGVAFYSIKEAHTYLKLRAKNEDKSVTDYQVKVIEIYEE